MSALNQFYFESKEMQDFSSLYVLEDIVIHLIALVYFGMIGANEIKLIKLLTRFRIFNKIAIGSVNIDISFVFIVIFFN